MDISRVRYFHVFAETGSLVKASEILHISQPALSKALRLLEHEVGHKLIEPDGRGLRLTQTGLRFKSETAHLLNQWMQVGEKLKASESVAPTRIGSFEVFTTYFLSHLVQFVELGPLEIHEYGPGGLEQAIAQNHVDVGITYLPIPISGIDFIEVAKIKMGVFGVKKFRSKKFGDLPFVIPLMPAEGTPSKVQGLDGWPDHKFTRLIQYRVAMMESAIQLCREGLSVAYLPEFVVDIHNRKVLPEFRLMELESPILQKDRLQSVFLVKRTSASEAQLHRQIAKSIRALSK